MDLVFSRRTWVATCRRPSKSPNRTPLAHTCPESFRIYGGLPRCWLTEYESNKRGKVSASVTNLAHYWQTARGEQTESSFPFADCLRSFAFGEAHCTDSTRC